MSTIFASQGLAQMMQSGFWVAVRIESIKIMVTSIHMTLDAVFYGQ